MFEKIVIVILHLNIGYKFKYIRDQSISNDYFFFLYFFRYKNNLIDLNKSKLLFLYQYICIQKHNLKNVENGN